MANQQTAAPLGSIVPGFDIPSTGEVLNAMASARRYILDDLDVSFHEQLCKCTGARNILVQGCTAYDCPQSVKPFFDQWNAFVANFVDFYVENVDFASRFFDTKNLYKQTQTFVERATSFRNDAARIGVRLFGEPLTLRRLGSPLGDFFGTIKNLILLGGGIWLGSMILPPIVKKITERKSAPPPPPPEPLPRAKASTRKLSGTARRVRTRAHARMGA